MYTLFKQNIVTIICDKLEICLWTIFVENGCILFVTIQFHKLFYPFIPREEQVFLLWHIEFLPFVYGEKSQKKFENIYHIVQFCKALNSVFQAVNITENVLVVCTNIIEISL